MTELQGRWVITILFLMHLELTMLVTLGLVRS